MAEPVLFTELVLPKGDKGDPGEPGQQGPPGPAGPNTVPTSEAIAAAVPDAVVTVLADQPEILAAAAELAQSEAGLVVKEDLEEDVFAVRFDDGDPFIEADEARGIFSKITPPADSIPAAALAFVRELSDDQGVVFSVVYEDKEQAFTIYSDGSTYPEIKAPALPKRKVVIPGDSMAAGWSSASQGLADKLGRVVSVRGNGGHRSFWIMARLGAQPLRVTVAGGVIPSTVTPLNVTLAFVPLVGASAGAPSATGSYPGVIDSIPGVLTITGEGVGTFTRSSAGRATKVAAGAPFVTGLDARDANLISISGRNNFKLAGDVDQVLKDDHSMMAWTMRPDRALIFDIAPWVGEALGTSTRNTLEAVNTRRRDDFPSNYLPGFAWLRSEETLLLAGITPTAQDLQDISEGYTPTSFRTGTDGSVDSGHINTKAYEALNVLINDTYAARGWMED